MQSTALQLSALEKKDRKERFARYRQLITKDGLTEAEIRELRTIMKALGKSVQDMQGDASILSEIATRPETIKNNHRLNQQMAEARANLEKAGLRRQAAISKAHDEFKVFVLAEQQATSEYRMYHQHPCDPEQLRREHPELLDFEAPPTTAAAERNPQSPDKAVVQDEKLNSFSKATPIC